MKTQTRVRYRTEVVDYRGVALAGKEQIVAYGYDPGNARFMALILTEAVDEERADVFEPKPLRSTVAEYGRSLPAVPPSTKPSSTQGTDQKQ